MSTLSDQQIEKFRMLYKAHYGKDVSKQVALKKGSQLVELCRFVYKPITKAGFQGLKARRRAAVKSVDK